MTIAREKKLAELKQDLKVLITTLEAESFEIAEFTKLVEKLNSTAAEFRLLSNTTDDLFIEISDNR